MPATQTLEAQQSGLTETQLQAVVEKARGGIVDATREAMIGVARKKLAEHIEQLQSKVEELASDSDWLRESAEEFVSENGLDPDNYDFENLGPYLEEVLCDLES